MIALLDATERNANRWPFAWSPDWYRQLAMSDSFTAHNVCCTSDINGYTQDFVHEMVLYALNANDLSLLDFLSTRLNAKTVPSKFWSLLQATEPIVQFSILLKIKNLDALEEPERIPVLKMITGFEPYFWMYDCSSWYANLSKKWNIVPPLHWWPLLYTLNLRRPPNARRTFVKHYRGSTVTKVLQLNGHDTYSIDLLENHRSEVLSQDPWAVMRGAFYGDTTMWPPLPSYSPQTIEMYTDALAILMHFYPRELKSDFHEKVPDVVRQGIPRIELIMFLGMPSGPAAFNAFSSWITFNNGQLAPIKIDETFPLTHLL